MNMRPAGSRGLLVELPDLDAVHRLTAAARQAREQGGLPGVVDLVPGYRTLLVTGDDPATIAAEVGRLTPMPAEQAAGQVVEIPVVYDGEDLADVARLAELSEDEVVQRHSGRDYLVAFLGFTPGFPYLVGLDPALQVARRSTPRTKVPAGSVGLAGEQTGIYPRPSPGGWQLLGRTDVRLFDPDRDPPALLATGDRLRFVPTDSADPAPEPERPELASGNVLVRSAGPLTTVQDLGRPGWAHLGVPTAGAVDRASARLANRLVGNVESAAVLEVTLGGVELEFDAASFVACCGAAVDVAVDGRSVGEDSGFSVPAGGRVQVGTAAAGLRCYLAVRGGIDVPLVLGSRSTDTLAGLGPAPLGDGDRLSIAHGEREPVYYELAPTPPVQELRTLRLVPGPRDDWFTAAAWEQLCSASYTVTSSSDRTGLRLEGPELQRSARDPSATELASEGMVAGAVQVPPDGQPILFLANHPTTGGYPVIGVVVDDDLPLAAQARPGSSLRFSRVQPPCC